MKDAYFPQEIEKKWQKIWEEKGTFKTPTQVINLNITLYQCSRIRQVNFTWDMSEIIRLPM